MLCRVRNAIKLQRRPSRRRPSRRRRPLPWVSDPSVLQLGDGQQLVCVCVCVWVGVCVCVWVWVWVWVGVGVGGWPTRSIGQVRRSACLVCVEKREAFA